MKGANILILDYSIDRMETGFIKPWLEKGGRRITSLFIDTGASFPEDLIERGFSHVVHSGSYLPICEEAPFTRRAVSFVRECTRRRIPQMGICYGHQLLSLALVGDHAVRKNPKGFEVGWKEVLFTNTRVKIPGVSDRETVWQSHFDEVTALPDGSDILAANGMSDVQAYLNRDLRLFGTQFHPEFTRQTGNQYFLEHRDHLEQHGADVDVMIQSGPSLDTGNVFFGFFIRFFK